MSVMSVTGLDAFVSEARKLRQAMDACHEVRVLLMNPYGPGAKQRAQSLGDAQLLLDACRRETEATIERLASLEAAGKKITLKFYDEPPFWSLIVTGEHVWVQYCHHGQELKTQPAQGLFPAFYVHFLNSWNDSSIRNTTSARGNEVKRVGFQPQPLQGGSLVLLGG